MRQIGLLPRDNDPRPLTDHLTSLGIASRVDEGPNGRVVWVYNEDHVARARQELDEFLKDPKDPRYETAEEKARALQRESRERDRQYRKNVRDMTGHWDHSNFRRRRLTVALIIISVVVYVFGPLGFGDWSLYYRLAFSSIVVDDHGQVHANALNSILRGEVYRLITPIFLHFSLIHLLFNMWWLKDLGTLVEYRRGTRTLAVLVIFAAIASNTSEFAYDNFVGRPVVLFGGMSGVVYALLGYAWMKGRHEPEQGILVHPQTVAIMLLWLVVCISGAVRNVSNTAHVVGLIVGMLFGLAGL